MSNPVIQHSAIRSILVIKLRAIGDVLLSTVVLKSLRKQYPDAVIDFLTERSSRDVVAGHPLVDHALIFDNREQTGAGLVLQVRRQRYDLVIDLFGNPRSALLTGFSGARYRVGYRFSWRKYCYNIIVEPRGGTVHNTEFNLDALRAMGVAPVESRPHFPVNEGAETFAEQFFSGSNLKDEFVVAINPNGTWYTKRWPLRSYSQLADILASRYGARILLIWGPGEQQDALQVQTMMSVRSHLLPVTSLPQLAAILKRCSMMVTNDSGPMHIAASAGTPIVAIFGPTRPELQGPYATEHEIVRNADIPCLGCNLTTCPIGLPCMEKLSPETVLTACQRLIERCHLTNFGSRPS